MAKAVTIKRPDVVALIEAAANRFTDGDDTEVVAMALLRLQVGAVRSGSLFGTNKGSVVVADGVDLTAPVLEDAMDAEVGPFP